MITAISPSLLSRMNKGEFDGRGVNCRFFREGNTGLKAYSNKDKAHYTYELQQRAYEYGLAPELLSPILRLPYGYAGYFTELAIPIGDIIEQKLRRSQRGSYNRRVWTKVANAFEKNSIPYNTLLSELESLDFDVSDMHIDNVGLLRKKLVAIDFLGDVDVELSYEMAELADCVTLID